MEIIEGDLLHLACTGEFDVIIHGTNCQNVMGAGIAYEIKEYFPEAFVADRDYLRCHGSEFLLGNFSSVDVSDLFGRPLIIVNAYTQLKYGEGLQVDYDAIDQVFGRIADAFPNKSIGYPKIGAGLGGGDWDRISKIIDTRLDGMDHTLVIYKES